MDEYTPLDLNAFHNAGLALLGEQRTAPIGPQQFRGLPFLVGWGRRSMSRAAPPRSRSRRSLRRRSR